MEHIGKALDSFQNKETIGPRNKSLETKVIDAETLREYEEEKAKRGYAANPYCKACGGSGYVHPRLPAGPPDYGKPDHSRVVDCQAEGCIVSQRRVYESTEAYVKEKGVSKFSRFEDFKPILGAETALAAFKDIAFNEEAPPLLLVYGTTGNGKTMLCESSVRELLKRGVDCRLWAVADLISKLKQSIPENTTELLMARLKKLPALILDEWGQNYGSDWEEAKLEEIVVAREREGLITIVTSNLEPDKLPERVCSRFRDKALARTVFNSAPDYRPKKRAKRRL